ncbi:hypothetical protein [Halocynthiibacter sp.]|uniref:hypothetical protein n=1 Tax=Halocynthiibacter sp. TaxID=1979210 RepID=UPI003C63FA97
MARDLEDPLTLDINPPLAAMKAGSKPIGTSFFETENVVPVVAMFVQAFGGEEAFVK